MEYLQLTAHGSRKMITFKHLVSVWVSVNGQIVDPQYVESRRGSIIGELALTTGVGHLYLLSKMVVPLNHFLSPHYPSSQISVISIVA